MQILILPSWYPDSFNSLGGIFFKEQAEALVKYGHNVSVIYPSGYSVLEILKYKKLILKNNNFTENGVDTYIAEYPVLPKLHKLKDKISMYIFKKIFETYKKKNGLPDIVHVHSFTAGKFALWIKENYGIPYVVTEHFSGFARGTISNQNLIIAAKVFKNSSCNIAVSTKFATLLEQKFKVDFINIPNIVNIDFFGVKERVISREFNFINIAFLDKNKNQDTLIKSFNQAFKNNDTIKLIIAGDGPEYNNLNNLIKNLDMTKQIKLYGRANREEVRELLQNSDAFVLSSQYETFGVVVIEAMACGLPVVATKCGGPESILQDERVGILSDIDENSLAKSMKYLYENRDKYDDEFIRNYCIENFSEESICKKLVSVYNATVK